MTTIQIVGNLVSSGALLTGGLAMVAYKSISDRFEGKYIVNDLTGCWEWQAMKIKGGYGMLGGESRPKGEKRINVLAHRFSYEHFVGPIPDGLVVSHTCDNPGCVNWQHLFVQTQPGNMKDMERKGRARLLSDQQVRDSIVMISEGWSQYTVADNLGVSRATLQRALKKSRKDDFGPLEVIRNTPPRYRKISDEQRSEIRLAANLGESVSSIARRYDIDRKLVRVIRDNPTEN